MAPLIHDITGDQYLAGFWRKYLLDSVIWTHKKSFFSQDMPRTIAEQWEIEFP